MEGSLHNITLVLYASLCASWMRLIHM